MGIWSPIIITKDFISRDDVGKMNFILTTGGEGPSYRLLPSIDCGPLVLAKHGRYDIAFLLSNDDIFPSFLCPSFISVRVFGDKGPHNVNAPDVDQRGKRTCVVRVGKLTSFDSEDCRDTTLNSSYPSGCKQYQPWPEVLFLHTTSYSQAVKCVSIILILLWIGDWEVFEIRFHIWFSHPVTNWS